MYIYFDTKEEAEAALANMPPSPNQDTHSDPLVVKQIGDRFAITNQ